MTQTNAGHVTLSDEMADSSMPSSLRTLKWAVERAHGCAAKFIGKVTVHEKRKGSTVWYGSVHIFDLTRHPKAQRCYAWAVEGNAGHEPQIITTLDCGPISSPEEAVRAALCENEARALRALRDLK